MDSETAAAAAASQISPSKENGASGVESETPVGGAPAFVPDDDYETASEPEDSDVKGSVAADGEKGGNPSTRILSEKGPSLDVCSEEEKGVATESSAVGDDRVEKGDGLGGGSIIEDERDEILGGGSKEAAPDSAAVGVEGESKEEGKGEGFAGDENSLELSEIGEKLEEKDEGNGESEVVAAASPLPVEEEETPIQEAGKETELNDVGQAEVEKDVAVDILGSDKNLEDATVEDSKPAEVELNAVAEAPKLDIVEEPNETNAAVVSGKEAEKGDKGTGVVMAKETGSNADVVDEATEWAAAEEDEKGTGVGVAEDTGPNQEVTTQLKAVADDTGAVSQRSLELETVEEKPMFNSDRVLTDLEARPSDGGGDMNPHRDVEVEPAPCPVEDSKSKAAETEHMETSCVMEGGTSCEISVESMLPASASASASVENGDMNPHHDVEVEPAPCSVEDSKSKVAETEHMETSGVMEGGTAREISVESMLPASASVEKVEPVAKGSQVAADDENPAQNETEEEEEEDNVSDQQPRVAILDSSETAKQIIKEMDKGSSSASFESSRSLQPTMDGQIVLDSDEEVDTDEEVDGKEELFDTAALAALLKAATGGSSDGSITLTSQDGTRVFSVDRPAGLGSSAPALRPAPSRAAVRPTLFNPSELAVTAEPENEMDEEERKLHEKVEAIRVKFLRLVMRLGHTSEDTVAAQVLYRLSLAEGIRRGRQMGRAFSIESAKKKAIQLEEEGEEDLNFSCNILVLGKTGVGKSATINSIFGEEKSHINAFQAATSSVREISGVVDGVKIRVIDTPGLKLSVMDQAANRRILSSIKKYTKKCPPDIVLYVDRLDTQTRDFNDLPLLRSITSALGPSIWFNAIVALTHAASAPPEGPSGPLSYEVFIAQRSHVVQHSIRQAAGDMRLMNPVALVENHPSCRRNREGQRVLPNGISWRPQLLLLCYSSKILSEANTLLKLQDPSPGKLFGLRLRSPPLPYLLSTLLQSRPHPKLSSDQGGDNGDSDIDLDDFSDAEDEEEDEYDQLPPFKPLKKSQLAMLTKEQKRAYFDEYDYRVRLLQKKQLKEEIRRLKEMKKRGKTGRDDAPYGDIGEDFDQDGAPAAVPVPLPDMVLPPSFDCDVPTYRYRFLEPSSQLLTRPVLDTHGWDHDCGYDGVSLEETLAIANRFPASVAVQITKDKKDFSIHLDSSIAAKLGENGSTLAGFDIQSIGKQLAYILRHETKFKNLKKNKTAAGISVTFLGDTVATGLKVEDQLMIGKRLGLVASTGAVKAQGDVAYGANLEARLREKDYPIGQALSTLGLSLMKWRGDLALGANLQSQVNVGRNSKVAVRVGLNNKLSGQITIRTSTSEQLQLALVGILPVALSIMRSIWPGESEYSR